VVRNAMQKSNGLFNRGKGYVNHVCGLHDLLRGHPDRETEQWSPACMHGEREASRKED
jgi:hypothetical protein